MTGALVSVDITGKDGATLEEKWEHGPVTYLGLTTVGFPNLFMITGPGSPSVLSNMTVSIEQHVEWIADQLAYLRDHGFETIEPTPTAEAGWVQHVNDCADITLYPTANSWYMGANVPGKPRVFLPYIGGVDVYRAACDEVVERGHLGFELTGPRGTQRNDGVVRRLQPDVALVLTMMAELDLPPIETMSVEEARQFMTDVGRAPPAGSGRRRDRRRRAAGRRRRPRVPPLPAGQRRPAPDRRLLPRRRLGARQPRVRRPVLPRPVRAERRRHRLGQLPPRAGGPLPRPPPTTGSPPCSGSPPTPRSSAVCRVSSPSPAGAPAPTSPPSCARRPATPAGPQITGQLLLTPGHRLRPHAGVVRRERRRLHPDDAADGVVLGPLRRSGRSQRPEGRRRCAPPTCPGCRRRSSSRASSTRCATRASPTPRRWRRPGCRSATCRPAATPTPR